MFFWPTLYKVKGLYTLHAQEKAGYSSQATEHMSGYRISQGAVLHALLARRQTYGYLPRRRTLSPALAGSNVSFVYCEQTDRQTDRRR